MSNKTKKRRMCRARHNRIKLFPSKFKSDKNSNKVSVCKTIAPQGDVKCSEEHIKTTSGLNFKTFDSFDEYRNEVNTALVQAAEAVINVSSPLNCDIGIIAKPAIKTKELIIGGRKFSACLFIDTKLVEYMSQLQGKNFAAVLQIWCNGGSVIKGITRTEIDDAGHDHLGNVLIEKDDVLNRAVASLRLHNHSPVIHQIAMHIAWSKSPKNIELPLYKGINCGAIYWVWD